MPTLDTRTALTTPVVADLIHVQDVSDTTDGANGTSKKVTLGGLQTLMNNHVNGDEAILLNGYSGNAPWRVFTSSQIIQATDQVLYTTYNCHYDPATGWEVRDVEGVPCIRHGFESYWNDSGVVNQLEWNLDVAPAGTGAPSFNKRLYGMGYYWDGANADNAAWQWRSNDTPSIGSLWDMILNKDQFQVGTHFTVQIATGVIAIGNAVASHTPTANRTIQISVGGGTLYLLASTSPT
jgi:hypothetical protein